MLDFLRNKFLYRNKYKVNSQAVIIACYFNPERNPYRLKAFLAWYETIKHMPHRIVECTIGKQKKQLPDSKYIKHIQTNSLLWHKEALLNYVVRNLPSKFKYVFWLDTDILFTNNNWLVESCKLLDKVSIVQPFEYGIHLEKGEMKPSFNVINAKAMCQKADYAGRRLWRCFLGNVGNIPKEHINNYNLHGHVGFAWGIRREILDKVPLYDHGLIGSGDHVIAHAAVGQIPSNCMEKAFKDDIDRVYTWSKAFYAETKGKIGYVQGDVYHIWHANLADRQYLKRNQEWVKTGKKITKRDKNGLFIHEHDSYMLEYFHKKEVQGTEEFLLSMLYGYITDSAFLGYLLGGDLQGAKLGDCLNPNDGDKLKDCGCGY